VREIKFRAWDRKSKAMFPVHEMKFGKISNQLDSIYGVDIHHKDSDHQGDVSYGGSIHKKTGTPLLPKFELMQYTGLKDEDDAELYEGDIIDFAVFDYNGSDTHYRGVIKFERCRFEIWCRWDEEYYGPDGAFDLYLIHLNYDGVKKVGNIYENPELMEVNA
jgi:uncharacterized phage protein (TIGR01671 family)